MGCAARNKAFSRPVGSELLRQRCGTKSLQRAIITPDRRKLLRVVLLSRDDELLRQPDLIASAKRVEVNRRVQLWTDEDDSIRPLFLGDTRDLEFGDSRGPAYAMMSR